MPQAERPKYQTFPVNCVQCGGQRWPYLLERPTAYVCQRCTATPKPEDVRERQRNNARRLNAARRLLAKPPDLS